MKNQNLTESDLRKIEYISSLENQILKHEFQGSGWRFDKIFSMTFSFYKTNERKGSNYVKISLRSSVVLNIGNDDEKWFHLVNISSFTSM